MTNTEWQLLNNTIIDYIQYIYELGYDDYRVLVKLLLQGVNDDQKEDISNRINHHFKNKEEKRNLIRDELGV